MINKYKVLSNLEPFKLYIYKTSKLSTKYRYNIVKLYCGALRWEDKAYI